MKYLIDIDGVVADFDSQMVTELLMRSESIDYKGVREGYDMRGWFTDPMEEFDDIFINALASAQFWMSLPVIPESIKWLNENSQADIYLCTKPYFVPGCLHGKQAWINAILPAYKNRVIYIENKEMLANPSTILVDDCPDNVMKFKEAGGSARLFAREYNSKEIMNKINNLSELFIES